jgi:hypothetical protein
MMAEKEEKEIMINYQKPTTIKNNIIKNTTSLYDYDEKMKTLI